MYDVEKRLKYLKMMQKKIKPEEYRHDGDLAKYSTESERYNAIYEEIKKCDDQELSNLEVLLNCEIESSKRFYDYSNIVPLTISILALVFSSVSQFVSSIMQIASEDVSVLEAGTDLFMLILQMIMILAIVCLIVYLFINVIGSKTINQKLYLLFILRNVKEKKGIA
nr:hypothetical protein [uncultured Acetatifactor sp.]